MNFLVTLPISGWNSGLGPREYREFFRTRDRMGFPVSLAYQKETWETTTTATKTSSLENPLPRQRRMATVNYKQWMTPLGSNVTWDRNSLIPNPVADVGEVRGEISTSPLRTDVKQVTAHSPSERWIDERKVVCTRSSRSNITKALRADFM